MSFANYPYYRDVYGGSLDKQTFKNVSAKASAYIDKITFCLLYTSDAADE